MLLDPKLSLSRFVIHKRQFSILILISVIVINFPVIFSSSEIRANMIDLTAIAGAVVTVFVFFTITLVKYVRKWEIDGFLPFLIGTLLWLAAEFTFAYYREGLGVEVPYPSFADLFWLLGYGFFLFHNYSVIAKLRGILTIDRSMIILVSARRWFNFRIYTESYFWSCRNTKLDNRLFIIRSECILSDYRWHTLNSIDDNILELTERRSFSHALVFNVRILCHGNNWRHRIWLQFCLES